MQHSGATRKLVRRFLFIGVLLATLGLAGSQIVARRAAACVSCYNESVTAYQYCHANPTGTYEGCNFVHTCSPYDSANSIYQQECLLKSSSEKR